MATWEIIRMALASLGVHKLRSILTVAGITIGVFSVIGVMTAVSALRGSIDTGLSFLGANTFQFAKYPTGVQAIGNNWDKIRKRPNITFGQVQRYRQLMADTTEIIRSIAWKGGAHAEYAGRQTSPNLNFGGTNEHYLTTNQWAIDQGRNFTADDITQRRPVVLIGQTLVQKLFPAESPLGKTITAAGHAYTVIGTLASKGTSFGQDQDEIALIPISRFLAENGVLNYSLNVATMASSQAEFNETLDKGITAMRIARGLKPGQENDFEVYSNDSLVAAFAKIADMVSVVSLGISSFALLAAGVGIMNIMLVSVKERTREIGVRKSVGARKATILTQFLCESVALSLAGGLVGILLGVMVGDGLALLMHSSVVFPWGWAAAGVLTCTVIGVGFGLYPAMQAAALDPIEALRYE